VRVDTREGSKEYIEPLLAAGLPVEPAILASGDVEIQGLGPGGRPLFVGIEIKQWEDVMQCVRSGRFADQLRAMKAAYEVSWLLIEGRMQIQSKAVAIRRHERWYEPPGKMTYQELNAWLLTMCSVGGVLPWRTESRQESVEWLRSLYWWWVSKPYEEHRAIQDFYQPPVTGSAPWEDPSLCAKWAVNLPGIGSGKATAVAEHFDSALDMAQATAGEWEDVPGVGVKGAKAITEAIRRGRGTRSRS
jgi:ERCC4-type nuclease